MNEAPHVCVDKLVAPKTYKERLALVRGKMWGPHALLRVAFLQAPSASLAKRIEECARQWSEFAGVSFGFGAEPRLAQIRIAFNPKVGSWSYVGQDCAGIPADQPTMNFGWLTDESPDEEVRRVVVHEFGHALGCIHEHQNPAAGLKWNKPVAYKYYEETQHWSEEEVDSNIFATYDQALTVYSDFDLKSIMLYPIPKEFLLEGEGAGWNTSLSETDKKFIAEMYPKKR